MIDVKNCYIYIYASPCVRFAGVHRRMYYRRLVVTIAGAHDVCASDALFVEICGGTETFVLMTPETVCGGAEWTTALATPVELYIYIYPYEENAECRVLSVCYHRIDCKCLVHGACIDCCVWCNRHRVCFMLELCLHNRSAMN